MYYSYHWKCLFFIYSKRKIFYILKEKLTKASNNVIHDCNMQHTKMAIQRVNYRLVDAWGGNGWTTFPESRRLGFIFCLVLLCFGDLGRLHWRTLPFNSPVKHWAIIFSLQGSQASITYTKCNFAPKRVIVWSMNLPYTPSRYFYSR